MRNCTYKNARQNGQPLEVRCARDYQDCKRVDDGTPVSTAGLSLGEPVWSTCGESTATTGPTGTRSTTTGCVPGCESMTEAQCANATGETRDVWCAAWRGERSGDPNACEQACLRSESRNTAREEPRIVEPRPVGPTEPQRPFQPQQTTTENPWRPAADAKAQQRELKNLRKQEKLAKKEIAKFEKEQAKLPKQIASYEKKIAGIEKQLASLESSTSVNALRKIETLERLLDQYMMKLEYAETRFDALPDMIQERNDQLAEVQERIGQLEARG